MLRSDEIKAEYLASGCQSRDTDVALEKLMNDCPSIFGNKDMAWSFVMEIENIEGEGV